jgi:hypothetical protein
MRRKIAILLSIGVAALAVSLILTGFLYSQRIEAHQGSASSAGNQKWEYCALTNSYGTKEINAVGLAFITYFEESGFRTEQIKIEGEMLGTQPHIAYRQAEMKAFSAAVMRLGSQGWELIGELPFPPVSDSNKALYFKRQK